MSDPAKYYSTIETNRYRSLIIAVVIAGFILLATDIAVGVYFGVTNKQAVCTVGTEQSLLPSSTPEGSTDLPTSVGTTRATTTPTDCCQCPDTWIIYNGSCYLFSHESKTFTDAVQFCTQHQSQLVIIETQDENNFLKSHSTDLKDAGRWIGLTDVSIEGTWVWMDGSDAVFTDWNPGEDNGKEENCALMWHNYQYLWADNACSKLHKPICEKMLYPC